MSIPLFSPQSKLFYLYAVFLLCFNIIELVRDHLLLHSWQFYSFTLLLMHYINCTNVPIKLFRKFEFCESILLSNKNGNTPLYLYHVRGFALCGEIRLTTLWITSQRYNHLLFRDPELFIEISVQCWLFICSCHQCFSRTDDELYLSTHVQAFCDKRSNVPPFETWPCVYALSESPYAASEQLFNGPNAGFQFPV
jgi:hypothetical protein